LLVHFTNLLQSGFQLAVIDQAAPHMSDFLWREADLTNDAAGIADSEHGDGVAFAAGAFGAAGAMADDAMEQGAAEDLAGLGEAGEEAVALADDLFLLHH
jgi:hypothetical protein